MSTDSMNFVCVERLCELFACTDVERFYELFVCGQIL